MELEEYKTALKNHDWFYDFSDDHSVWQRGTSRRTELLNIAKAGSDDFKRAFNEEYSKHFKPPTFPTAKPPFEFPSEGVQDGTIH